MQRRLRPSCQLSLLHPGTVGEPSLRVTDEPRVATGTALSRVRFSGAAVAPGFAGGEPVSANLLPMPFGREVRRNAVLGFADYGDSADR